MPFRLAASLAFYTIFSIAPLLLIAVLVASLFFTREAAAHRIEGEVQNMVGEQGAQAVRQIIEATRGLGSSVLGRRRRGGHRDHRLHGGLRRIAGRAQQALDVELKVRRGLVLRLIADRARSFVLVLGVGFLLLVSLVISGTLNALQDYLAGQAPRMPWLWNAGNFLTSFTVAALLFAMVYRFLPDVQLGWKDVWRGSLVTALLFTVGKSLIGLYLGHAMVAGAYGAAGSFVILLFWIYYSSLISFFGAEFTQVYARRHGAGIQPAAHAQRVGLKPDRL